MEAKTLVSCWCPSCREQHEEQVAVGEREGPWYEGRLIRVCLSCEVGRLFRIRKGADS